MIIALCNDIPGLNNNKIFDQELARFYPGAGWASIFAEKIRTLGGVVITGDVAVAKIKKDEYKPEKILVIQELNSRQGELLVKMGAIPLVITCYESPMYAYRFYDNLVKNVKSYKYRVFFNGMFDGIEQLAGNNIPLCFQCYFKKEIKPLVPWKQRKYMVQVVSNKYFLETFSVAMLRKPIATMRMLKNGILRNLSPNWKTSCKNELHTKRLEAIEFFGKVEKLDVFGKGWENLSVLSKNWQKRLTPILSKIKPTSIEDKLMTVAQYKFAICFENISYPGYVTEKIIDCFVAGVIPIYLGAPDIAAIIPRDAFVDKRNFSSWDQLDQYLANLQESEALKIIAAGRTFLECEVGMRYSYEGFADFMTDLVVSALPEFRK